MAPNRSAAAAWAGGLLVIAYLAVTISSVTDRLEWLRYLSPYYYTDLPGILEDGPDGWHQIVLFGLLGLTTAAALRAWEGREFGVGNWQWRALVAGGAPGPSNGNAPAGRPEGTGVSRWPPSRRGVAIALSVLVLVGVTLGVGVAAINRGALPIGQHGTLSLSGRVDATSAKIYLPASGVARLVLAEKGDEVHQGQVIAWVTSAIDGTDLPVVAPLDGALTDLTLAKGQNLAAGTPVGEVHETGHLRAAFEVDEADLKSIQIGQAVELSIGALGLRISSEVGSVSGIPISEAGQGRTKPKYEVWCPLLDPNPRIAVGMRVQARIQR